MTTKVGVSVQREYTVECTSCGVLDSRPSREQAGQVAAEHVAEHKGRGDVTGKFLRWIDANDWATE